MYFSSIDPSSFRPRSLICTLRRPRASGGVCSKECTAVMVQDSSTSSLPASGAAVDLVVSGYIAPSCGLASRILVLLLAQRQDLPNHDLRRRRRRDRDDGSG